MTATMVIRIGKVPFGSQSDWDTNREAVESGAFKTDREYYFKVGQFEPNNFATFVGTSGNDIVTGAE
ncbi:MAG: hypothetical protein ACEQSN_11930, partial [Yersinia sp. (in: enterobacteria)]